MEESALDYQDKATTKYDHHKWLLMILAKYD